MVGEGVQAGMPISEFLARSSATPEFREAVWDFLADGRPRERIRFGPGSPAVKVKRVLAKLLEHSPTLALESVAFDARSGCDYYRGTVRARHGQGTTTVDFEWNCRWKAKEMGWTDYFGFPDQIRAVREFGYDCFRVWQEVEDATPAARTGTLSA